MERLLSNETYRTLFTNAFPETPLESLDITAFANALAVFIVHELTPLESPWDGLLNGDDAALDDAARRGASLFFGEAQCATCHARDSPIERFTTSGCGR